ncbi:Hypothetical predicted protein [Olea europaea subsp. europaea]|uniref:Uncharacterized protein n=1 Tax=Olea europaea subsp. europaea TaxID=158383 RepID=A0A8S0PDY2_OLEEU|nr:Hypothetical predicted protein [Olea europaea subsp. europaea]
MSFESSIRCRINAPLTVVFSIALLLIMGIYTVSDHGLMKFTFSPVSSVKKSTNSTAQNNSFYSSHRKLFFIGGKEEEQKNEANTNRIWDDNCSESDIVISQGQTQPLPNGIPTYTVEIMNVCVAACNISRIHVSCGWFSSARLINPHVFKRLHFNDCLVNDGKPLEYGYTISFQYANTYSYPLSVSSIAC